MKYKVELEIDMTAPTPFPTFSVDPNVPARILKLMFGRLHDQVDADIDRHFARKYGAGYPSPETMDEEYGKVTVEEVYGQVTEGGVHG